jgi:hypothetical protein
MPSFYIVALPLGKGEEGEIELGFSIFIRMKL